MKTRKFPIIFLFTLLNFTAFSQRTTEVGVTGGGIRFYPEVQHGGSNSYCSMDNGWGWSAGIFAEDHWKPKIHQVVEVNYYHLSSDVHLQKDPDGFWSPYNGNDGRKPVYGNFSNNSFSQISVTGGIKYFLTRNLFVFPGFEFARALNQDIDINKTSYNIKAGAGISISRIDIVLEYAYGMKYQRMVYDPSVPFVSTHRNKYLQLKVQVPFYQFR